MQIELTERQVKFLYSVLSDKNGKFSMPSIFKKDESFVITSEDRHAMHGFYKKIVKLRRWL